MNHYLIYPSTIAGYSIIAEKESYDYPEGRFPIGALVMEIDSLDYHQHLFTTENLEHLFITNHLKEVLEKEDFPEISYRRLDFLVIGQNLSDNYPDHRFSKDSFWMIEIKDGGIDFMKWKSNLIVSERALDFLSRHNAFSDNIEGAIYGPKFEVLTNRFLIEGDIESFILNRVPVYRKNIAAMRQKIHDEYLRRENLLPN